MKTLNQFKQENGVTTIDFLKGKGRAFATVANKDVIIGASTDLKKPLYVIHNEEKGFYCVVNSEATLAVTL